MLTKPGDKIKLTLSLPNGFGDSTHDAVVTKVLKNGRVYASLDGNLPPMKFGLDGRGFARRTTPSSTSSGRSS